VLKVGDKVWILKTAPRFAGEVGEVIALDPAPSALLSMAHVQVNGRGGAWWFDESDLRLVEDGEVLLGGEIVGHEKLTALIAPPRSISLARLNELVTDLGLDPGDVRVEGDVLLPRTARRAS